jgi:predicted HicB family RNase H-like nuclease
MNDSVAYAPAPVSTDRGQEAYRVAGEMFRQEPDWVTFFREVLGVDGVVQQMLARLRDKNDISSEGIEPTRVITVRMPKSLHESLRAEAHMRKTSMNKLCISKLLQMIDDELVPQD